MRFSKIIPCVIGLVLQLPSPSRAEGETTISPSRAKPAIASVTLTLGTVSLNGRRTKSLAKISAGDSFETEDGKATLVVGREAVVHLGENTKVVFNSRREGISQTATWEGDLTLDHGLIRAIVHTLPKAAQAGGAGGVLKVRSKAGLLAIYDGQVIALNPSNPAKKSQFTTIEGRTLLLAPHPPGKPASAPLRIRPGEWAKVDSANPASATVTSADQKQIEQHIAETGVSVKTLETPFQVFSVSKGRSLASVWQEEALPQTLHPSSNISIDLASILNLQKSAPKLDTVADDKYSRNSPGLKVNITLPGVP